MEAFLGRFLCRARRYAKNALIWGQSAASVRGHNDFARRGDIMRRLFSVMWFLFAAATLAMPVAAGAQIIDITIAPPELPVYEQPPIPAPGYIWAPGYWAFDPDDGYYWVPGTWVLPPDVGLLWTPGYWGWRDGLYVWNDGYWGPQVGFYGGVDYGYGYGGDGYEGGYWDHGVFAYNRAVNNFGGIAIANAYERPVVIVNPEARRVSFNGGNGGTVAQPTAHERAAAHERHVAPTAIQTEHRHMASTNKALFASKITVNQQLRPLPNRASSPARVSWRRGQARHPCRPNCGAPQRREQTLPARRRSRRRERPVRAWQRRTTRMPSAQRRSSKRERPLRAWLRRTTRTIGTKTFEEKGTAGRGLATPNNRMPSAQRRSRRRERPVRALLHRTTRMPSAQRRSSKKERPVEGLATPNNPNAVGSKTFEQRGTAGKVLTTPGNTVNLGTKPVGNALPTQTPKPNLPLRAPTTAAVKPPPPPPPPPPPTKAAVKPPPPPPHHHHHRPRLRLSRRRALPARQ